MKFPVSLNSGTIKVTIIKPEKKFSDKYLIILALLLSIIATLISIHLNIAVAYNDARSHLNMARLVIDNLKPGFTQIGSVWLPLNHLFELTLIWNDWLWHTGLAGTIFSMVSYVLTVYLLFKLFKDYLKEGFSALLGTLVFAGNLNILYMQSTPMTESLLLLFFVSTTYYLYQWIKNRKLIYLLLTALSVCLATLTRYDGWFLLFVVLLIVFLFSGISDTKSHKLKDLLYNFRSRWSVMEGNSILFLTLAGFGIFLWLVYNWAIFKDPFYFAFGPYSAYLQQKRIEAAGALPTKYNFILSFLAYWWAMVNNAGLLILLFSLVGFFIFFFQQKISWKAITMYTLLTPLVFHFISLYFGHSILVLPEMGVAVTTASKGSWFNVRYGLMMLPAVAFFSAYFASKANFTKIILIFLILIQPLIFIKTNNVITVTDGTQGSSSLRVANVASWLKKNAINDKDLILLSISYNNALAFSTGFPLKRFIHEGTGKYWDTSLNNPEKYAGWIVMANGDVGDPVYESLIKERGSAFLNRFELVAKFEHLNIYRKRDTPPGFIYKSGIDFYQDGKPYRFFGVNSYDLLYRTQEEIEATISEANKAGFKVIRFWAFGDGLKNGVQTSQGIYQEEKLKILDFILDSARRHDLKVIPVFVNYWDEYGGVKQYLKWAGINETAKDAFYENQTIKNYYKNYLKIIITRKNTQNNLFYNNDPTILAWGLINEPRVEEPKNIKIMFSWIKEINDYIRIIDQYHLISIDSEGSIPGNKDSADNSLPDFSQIGSLESTKILTGHYYLRDKKAVTNNFRHPLVSDWKKISDQKNKPLVIEEVGFSKNQLENNNVARDVLYRNLFEEVIGHGVPGTILWNWALKLDDNYGISPNDPQDKTLILDIMKFSKKLDEK